jgi:hypothetical protein
MNGPYFSINGPTCREEGEVLLGLYRDDAGRQLWRWWQGEVENVLPFHLETLLRDVEIVDTGSVTCPPISQWRYWVLYFQGKEVSKG